MVLLLLFRAIFVSSPGSCRRKRGIEDATNQKEKTKAFGDSHPFQLLFESLRMAMKRSRRGTCNLGVITIFGLYWIPFSFSEETSFQDMNAGSQYTSQECAVQRPRRRKLVVSDVSILCDSGQNNYNTYQNRPTCRVGDLGKAAISFETRRSAGSGTTVFIDMTTRALGKSQRVYNYTNICNDANLISWVDEKAVEDDMYGISQVTTCPLPDGFYTFFATFTVSSHSKNSDHEFTPALRIDFYNEDHQQIGCVETGSLAEIAYHKKREQQGQRFFVVSFLLLCLLSTFCLLGHRRRKKQGEHANMKRQASIMRRFHYIQTTRSGDIGPAVTSSESGSRSFGSGERSSPRAPMIPQVDLNVDVREDRIPVIHSY